MNWCCAILDLEGKVVALTDTRPSDHLISFAEEDLPLQRKYGLDEDPDWQDKVWYRDNFGEIPIFPEHVERLREEFYAGGGIEILPINSDPFHGRPYSIRYNQKPVDAVSLRLGRIFRQSRVKTL